MAKTVVVVLRCDRCKGEEDKEVDGAESVSFAYDGFTYELDLCTNHAEDFHNAIHALITWASERKPLEAPRPRSQTTSGDLSPSASKPSRAASDRDRLKSIRDWARQNGHPDLSDRGRIPQRILDEYQAAHG